MSSSLSLLSTNNTNYNDTNENENGYSNCNCYNDSYRNVNSIKRGLNYQYTPKTENDWLQFDYDFKKSRSSSPLYFSSREESSIFLCNTASGGASQMFSSSYVIPPLFEYSDNGRSGKFTTPI